MALVPENARLIELEQSSWPNSDRINLFPSPDTLVPNSTLRFIYMVDTSKPDELYMQFSTYANAARASINAWVDDRIGHWFFFGDSLDLNSPDRWSIAKLVSYVEYGYGPNLKFDRPFTRLLRYNERNLVDSYVITNPGRTDADGVVQASLPTGTPNFTITTEYGVGTFQPTYKSYDSGRAGATVSATIGSSTSEFQVAAVEAIESFHGIFTSNTNITNLDFPQRPSMQMIDTGKTYTVNRMSTSDKENEFYCILSREIPEPASS